MFHCFNINLPHIYDPWGACKYDDGIWRFMEEKNPVKIIRKLARSDGEKILD